MRRLILLRHAKSSWNIPGQPDHDRRLNERGRRAARAIGRWLAATGHVPDEVLCSAALRTRETWDQVARELKTPPGPRCLDALYHADPDGILDCVAGAEGRSVLVIGHNPGMAMLAAALVAAPPDHPKFAQFPTGATLICEFEVEGWAALRPGTGRAVDFVVPRDLTD